MKFTRVSHFMLIALLLFFVSCKQKGGQYDSMKHPAFQHSEVKSISDKISRDPANARLYFERGQLLHKMNEDTLALNDFKKATTLDSTQAEYFSAVGDLLFEHKDINGSVSWFETAIRLNPNDAKAHLKIAKLMIYIKDYTKAFSEINIVLRQNAMVPEGYFLKGMIYKDLLDTAKAISSFQTAVQIDPDYKEALVQLGLVYSAQKNLLALKYFDNAFESDTSDVFPLYAKAMFLQDLGKYEEAKDVYAKCIHFNPDYSKAYFGIGWILMQQDSFAKANQQFDLVTKLEPTYAEAYYNRGLSSELSGNKKEAAEDYKQALIFKEDYQEAKEGINRLK